MSAGGAADEPARLCDGRQSGRCSYLLAHKSVTPCPALSAAAAAAAAACCSIPCCCCCCCCCCCLPASQPGSSPSPPPCSPPSSPQSCLHPGLGRRAAAPACHPPPPPGAQRGYRRGAAGPQPRPRSRPAAHGGEEKEGVRRLSVFHSGWHHLGGLRCHGCRRQRSFPAACAQHCALPAAGMRSMCTQVCVRAWCMRGACLEADVVALGVDVPAAGHGLALDQVQPQPVPPQPAAVGGTHPHTRMGRRLGDGWAGGGAVAGGRSPAGARDGRHKPQLQSAWNLEGVAELYCACTQATPLQASLT